MSRQENSNRETFMHTQEPWPEEIAASAQDVVFKLVRVLSADAEAVLMNKQDYERARLCVNTLAGRDPGELAELERIIAAVVQSPYFNSAFDTTNEAEPTPVEHISRLRSALGAFLRL